MYLFYALLLSNSLGFILSSKQGAGLYTNEFAVKVLGGHLVAKEVAGRHGFEYIDKIGTLADYYLFKQQSIPTRSKRSADTHIKSLNDDPKVEWHKQQISLVREKREEDKKFDDPRWDDQWYLRDSRKHSMNVVPVWNRGITGKGVVVSVLDDGLEYTNDDLVRNYDKEASYNYNANINDPLPEYDETDFNNHGTRCAGEIAAEANNGICGVGVAYNAKIGGICVLDGDVTDATEARAFGHRNDYIDIYSASWGPSDNGMTLEGPEELAYDAIEIALEKGRNGKGNIFVWAAGNGGYSDDDCNCDGYVNNIGTIAIGSIVDNTIPQFTEKCSAVMAATYSFPTGDQNDDHLIITTDLHNGCTDEFSGTSASAPIAAGIIALALEKNPDLTWRDVQHIVVWTSKRDVVKAEPGWFQNGAGLWAHRAVGFGLMDAEAIVEMADPKTWKTVPKQNQCVISYKDVHFKDIYIKRDEIATIPIPVDGCYGTKDYVKYVEHVEFFLDLTYPYRGSISVNMTSNSGTNTILLSPRKFDTSEDGLFYWPFTSVHYWGEESTSSDNTGEWKVSIWDSLEFAEPGKYYGPIDGWYLILHGTETLPEYRQKTKPTTQKPKISDSPAVKDKRSSQKSADDEPVVIKRRSVSRENRDFLHSLHRRRK
ncbi:neuroendocrine convertase 1-like [Amphiura filiformis]|uniref:neuroendocrine convertase 1-like n=1 Tax=Amphiura filiformis TaxID=82378 RepID=UPI003B218798